MKYQITKRLSIAAVSAILVLGMSGCNQQTSKSTEATQKTEATTQSTANEVVTLDLEDGIYTVDFSTDSTMFHINEVYDGKATMTVENGQGTVHIVLPSKNILNLYVGLAEDAQKEGEQLLEPTEEEVTYEDGTTETVNAFDVPVPAIGEEFDLALVGTKGKWYDHKVSVSNPQASGESEKTSITAGEHVIEVSLEGGSGKATIESPAKLNVKDDNYILTVVWSSPYYDYMLVDGEKYEPVNTEGNSVFEIPVMSLDEPLEVVADTVAMSQPHEIEYTIHFDTSTLQ